MNRWLRRIGIAAGVLLGLVLVVALVLYSVGSSRIGRSYEIRTATMLIPTDSGAIARGAHLARIHGCTDCHGPDLSGRVFADEPPFRVVASNLTRGRGGVGGQYSPETFDRAIRHGVGVDGQSLLIMPSVAFNGMSDEDVSHLIAYLQQVPPVDKELPATEVRPLGRILSAFAIDPAFEVRTGAARVTAPPPAPTVEYGEYLTSMTCAYCHGPGLEGAQPPAPGSPPAPALSAAGGWDFDGFQRTLRTGITPDGRRLDPEFMPWALTAQMTEPELRALHAYLATLSG
ncbi:MAG: cytochrome c [Gemmatimonadota bacterium]